MLMKAQLAVSLFFNCFTGGRFLAILKPPPQTSGSRIQVRSADFQATNNLAVFFINGKGGSKL